MKTFLSLVLFEIKKNLAEPYTLFMFIVLPVMLMFLLGTTFGEMMTPDIGQQNRFLIYTDTEDPLGMALVDYLNVSEVKRVMQYDLVDSPEEVLENYKSDQFAGYVILEAGSIDRLANGERVQLSYTAKYSQAMFEGILSGFVEGSKIYMTFMEEGIQPSVMDEVSVIRRGQFNEDNTYPTGMDYYAIQSLLQMLVFAAILGSSSLTRDYENDAYVRIETAPVSRGLMLAAKIFGNGIYVLGAALISLSISRFVFGANISGNFLLISVGVVLFVFINVGIGIIIGSLIKQILASIGITIGVMMFFSSVSGALTPEATHDLLQRFTPNYYATTVIFGSIYGYDTKIIYNAIVSLLIGMIVIYAIGIALQRRKKA